MIDVELSTGTGRRQILSFDAPVEVWELQDHVAQLTGLRTDDFYIVSNGRLAYPTDKCQSGHVRIVPRLLGGKGGFGSMLRAIGAQIEKTTNREACRDLSGRRLRDINEEKRLKAWIEKQGTRDEEAAERKKKKIERLCAEPRHEFKDQNYERERSILTERVGDAIEQGFKEAVTSAEKRKHEEAPKPIRKKTLLDMDFDSDELDSSDESSDEGSPSKKLKINEKASNDSGHSSDESGKTSKRESDQGKDDCKEESQSSTSADSSEDATVTKTNNEPSSIKDNNECIPETSVSAN